MGVTRANFFANASASEKITLATVRTLLGSRSRNSAHTIPENI
jgi:hypothetical protein